MTDSAALSSLVDGRGGAGDPASTAIPQQVSEAEVEQLHARPPSVKPILLGLMSQWTTPAVMQLPQRRRRA